MEGLIVLHGAPRPSGFALWAEGLFAPHDGRDRHPRALEPRELLEALSAEGLASPVLRNARRRPCSRSSFPPFTGVPFRPRRRSGSPPTMRRLSPPCSGSTKSPLSCCPWRPLSRRCSRSRRRSARAPCPCRRATISTTGRRWRAGCSTSCSGAASRREPTARIPAGGLSSTIPTRGNACGVSPKPCRPCRARSCRRACAWDPTARSRPRAGCSSRSSTRPWTRRRATSSGTCFRPSGAARATLPRPRSSPRSPLLRPARSSPASWRA